LKQEIDPVIESHAVEEPSEMSLEEHLRKCDVDFEELLKAKIISKGNTLQDMKRRLEDQKNLIVKLRDGKPSLQMNFFFFI
jgi:MarR-like DNA-binding transcriptional regulator SgrR of sgrS sRNA